MFCGKVFEGEYQLRLDTSGGGAIGGGTSVGWNGSIYTSWTPNYSVVNTGIWMTLSATKTGSGTTQTARLRIPSLSIDTTRTYSDDSLVDQLIHIEGLKIYMDHTGVWTVKYDTLTWSVRGAVELTSGSYDQDGTMMPTPSSMPLIGIYPELEPGCGINPALAIGCISPGRPAGTTRSANASVTGGWRIKPLGEDWYSPPVAFPDNPFTGAPATGTVSGSDCWSVTSTAYRQIVDAGSSITSDHGFSKVLITPSLDRGVVQMDEDDYAALVFRWGFPKIEATTVTSDSVTDCEFEPISDSNTTTVEEVYPAHTQFLEEVNETGAVITDPMSQAILSPVSYAVNRIVLKVNQIEYASRSYLMGYDQLTVGDTASYLGHSTSWIPIFCNTWPNPLWSYALFFPPDSDDPGDFQWEIDGAPMKASLYWLPARQQHLYHPALPEDGSGRRNHVLAEPITNPGLLGLWLETLGMPAPWGISRFYAQVPTLTECAPDDTSASLYSCEEIDPLTVTSAGVEVASGGGPTSFTLDLNLGDFSIEPYQSVHVASEIRIEWTNATSVEAYLVGVDGSEVRLNPLGDQGWFARPQGDSPVKYGHTAQNDFGQQEFEDTGTERKLSKSIAPNIASDAERSIAPGLLNGFTAEKLRWKVTRSTGVTTTIKHPRFRAGLAWDERTNLPETAQHSTTFGEEAPGVRLGTLQHWDYTLDAVMFPPGVHPQMNQPTVWDALRSKRLLFEAKSVTDGLTTEIQNLYEEGVEWTQIKHLASDPFNQQAVTSAFWVNSEVGPINCLVSSYREPPPLGLIPRRKRTSASGWEEDPLEDFALLAYSYCPARRWHIAPGESIRLMHGSPEVDQLTGKTTFGGWTWGYHELPVDGSETYDWKLSDASEWYAKVRPWRGFHLLPGELGGAGRCFYDISKDLRHVVGFVDSDKLWLNLADASNPKAWSPFDTGQDAEWCGGCWASGASRPLAVILGQAGDAKLYLSDDEGASFTLAQTLGSATSGDVFLAPDLALWCYRLDTGTLKYHVLSPDGSTVVESGSTNLSGLDEEPVALHSIGSGENAFTVAATVVNGGTREVLVSTDGKTFA